MTGTTAVTAGSGPTAVLTAPAADSSASTGGTTARRKARRAGAPGAWCAALAITSAAVWLAYIGFEALLGTGNVSGALMTAQIRMVGPALVAVILAVFLAERLWPAVPRPVLDRAHVVDAGYLALFALIAPAVALMNTGFAVTVERYAPFLSLGRLPLLPRVVVVGIILIGIDAMNWLAHVANHRSTALWRFHALHHSQEDMSVFTTFRTHPLAHASYLPALFPALILEASGTVPGAALIVYGCLVTLPHANLRWTFGPMGRILVSPAYHRLHHASTPIDDRVAVNFGFVLVCWDRLARCAVYPSGAAPIRTGISGRPVPIEQTARRFGVARVFGAQLVQPFRMNAATDGPS
jgi:sterol desaturase/sphingolipid hydroxylase (fatty acid hydroxylase superfamily)